MNTDQAKALGELFFDYNFQRRNAVTQRENPAFVHYTSASTAVSIIENNEVWLRNALVMNDYSEIKHGEQCLGYAWRDPETNQRLKTILGRLDSELYDRLAKALDDTQTSRLSETFIMSLSEHGDAAGVEDQFGRLSMWRAYGGNENVALVFNTVPFFAESNSTGISFSPVLYRDVDQFHSHEFKDFLDRIEDNIDFLSSIPSDALLRWFYGALMASVLSIKHPGFAEEREWRLIHFGPVDGALRSEIKVAGGIPQEVRILKLENRPDKGLFGATIPEVLERIIVGPTMFPQTIGSALVRKLQETGVDNAGHRVTVSGIPLRR